MALAHLPRRHSVTARSQAYQALREAIVAGELSPGTRLSENELAEAFHHRLCDLSGRPIAWSVGRRANGHLDRVRRLSLPVPSYLAEKVDEHRRVVDAVGLGDPDRADAALRHHLRMVLSELPR